MGAMTPQEIADLKNGMLPEAVLDVWNKLIASHLTTDGRATIKQDDAVLALLPLTPGGDDRGHIFDKKWLDIEDVYRKAGWDVTFDKAFAYAGETGGSTFYFKSK